MGRNKHCLSTRIKEHKAIYICREDTVLDSRVYEQDMSVYWNEESIVHPFWNNLGGPTAEAIQEERHKTNVDIY